MSIIRQIRWFTFLAMLVALMSGIREIPELASLMDDVSNDGEAVEFASRNEVPSSVRESGNDAEFVVIGPVLKSVRQSPSSFCPRILRLAAGKTRLRLLSLLRE